MPSSHQLGLERAVARAHRALWDAQGHAEALGADGLALDLDMLYMEIGRVGCDLIAHRSPKTVQLRLERLDVGV